MAWLLLCDGDRCCIACLGCAFRTRAAVHPNASRTARPGACAARVYAAHPGAYSARPVAAALGDAAAPFLSD